MPPRAPPRGLADIFVTGWSSNHQPLTPRTPHTRSGRAEEGLTEVELSDLRNHPDDDDDDDEYLAVPQQSEPLLRSSASSNFPAGYRSQGDDHDILGSGAWFEQLRPAVERFCYVAASVMVCLLLAMFTISLKWTWGEMMHPWKGGGNADPPVDAAVFPNPLDTSATIPLGRIISYENYTAFPLTGTQYRHECLKTARTFMQHVDFWTPPKHGPLDVPHHDDVTNHGVFEDAPPRVCSTTITYQLDGHVGLAADLAFMAQAAAFARERGRTFLIDDTYWNRGKWTDHFQDVRSLQPGPEPGCEAPPPEELVACPRTARHWVLNSRTAKFHLGRHFSETYEDPHAHKINRQRPIFERALEAFVETIQPNAHNARLIRAAREEVAAILSLADTPDELPDANPYISVHIRRGDHKAVSLVYHDSYIPLENYAQAARDTWARLYPDVHVPRAEALPHFPTPPITWVASDAPDALREFIAAFPSATAIFALDTSTNAELRALAPTRTYVQAEFNMEEEEERIRLTRGMIVDLAMLTGFWSELHEIVPGAVVCTISSVACKISALGFGFEQAFGFDDGMKHVSGIINEKRKRWVEIDNQNTVVAAWEAFGLFS